jgi:divalent metal cation (Fe/Co/Zn/Cd) transporter
MEEIMEIMAAQMIPVIVAALATLVSVGLVRLNRWLKMKTGSEAVAAAGEIVAATVNGLTATTVKNLKAAAADGKLTINEAHMVKDQALARVKSQLPPAVAKAASMVIGDLDILVNGKIEQAVGEQKR